MPQFAVLIHAAGSAHDLGREGAAKGCATTMPTSSRGRVR